MRLRQFALTVAAIPALALAITIGALIGAPRQVLPALRQAWSRPAPVPAIMGREPALPIGEGAGRSNDISPHAHALCDDVDEASPVLGAAEVPIPRVVAPAITVD